MGHGISATASCSSGKDVLGGGATVASSGAVVGVLADSYPSDEWTWTVRAVVVVPGTGTITVTSYALCSP
jgi:hypothetical protein